MNLNYGPADFIGILLTILLYAFMTNLLQWGIYIVMKHIFEDDKEHENIFHHHYHYKAKVWKKIIKFLKLQKHLIGDLLKPVN